jgi:hypothetical protein
MKIAELIQPGERKGLPEGADIKVIWDRILTRHCTQAIAAYRSSGGLLYRGMKSTQRWFRAAGHTQRQAKDSHPAVAAQFDRLLAQCGMTALRSNSVFASSSHRQAMDYGRVYVIFPIDGFRFTYTNEKDLVLDTWKLVIDRQMMSALTAAYVRAMKKREGEDWEMSWLYTWITHGIRFGKRGDADPGAALERLKGLSDERWIQDLEVDDLFKADDFCRRYEPTDQDLEQAIRRGVEVMISGQYYAFRDDHYGEALRLMVKR